MLFASIVGLILLSVLGAGAAQAQYVTRTALAYRSLAEPGTPFQVVHVLDSVQVKSNKARNVWIGIAVGAALGGSTAYVLSKRSCGQGTFVCDEPAPVIVPTVLFTILGGIGGGTVVHLFGRPRSAREAQDFKEPRASARSLR
jgi:hypothetical protein